MRIQTFNERHSRDKIENFLKEVETKDGMNKIQLAKAWDEYKSLMKSEKTLAYKYPKQFFDTLKDPQHPKRHNVMRLDQSPLSKLIGTNIKSVWKEGARIQFESLQASDQQLSDIENYDSYEPIKNGGCILYFTSFFFRAVILDTAGVMLSIWFVMCVVWLHLQNYILFSQIKYEMKISTIITIKEV
uniref:Uncharacterized protein n=1 Tax=Magallana gigas TaxID=29159 RepID=K1QG21_MAGGI